MQRKNRILKTKVLHKNGFAMIMAIAIMILVSTIMISMLSLSSENSKRMSNTYLYEQAHFLARSGVEYAILAVSGHDRNQTANAASSNNCIENLNIYYPAAPPNSLFEINVSIDYIGFGNTAECRSFIPNISTPESNGTMLIDVTVSTSTDLNLSEPIRFHRRTLQKM